MSGGIKNVSRSKSVINLLLCGAILLVYINLMVPVYSQEEESPKRVLLERSEAHEKLQDLINSQLRKEDVHGLSISVLHDQETWFDQDYGFADAENKIATSKDTQFRLGAISSILTAILVLQLEERGLLKISDPISKYFPDIKFKSRDNSHFDITIKQLLTHHSGLPLSILKNSWAERPPTYQDLFSGDYEIYFSQAPDTIYTYSNLGYDLLGLLIEKITQKSYEEVLTSQILKPLGMNRSGVSKPGAQLTHLAKGYKKGVPKTMLFPRDLPSLGVYSSSADVEKLLKHINSILGGRSGILSIAAMQNMIRIQNIHVALDLGNKVGLGWMITGLGIDGAGPLLWRGGASLYHRSRIALLPQKKIAVIVMANESTSWDVVEKITDSALKLALESLYGLKPPVVIEKQSKSREGYGAADTFTNNYTSFVGYIPVSNAGKNIQAEVLGWTVLVNPDGHGWYDLQYDLFGFIPIDISWIANIKIKPVKIENKRVIIVLYKETQHLFASELLPQKATLIWRRRVGKYEISNPDILTEIMEVKEGELVLENEQLFFTYELPMFIGLELKVPLQVINDQMAIIPGLGTALNEIVQIKYIGGREVLEYSGYQLSKKKRKGFFE